MAAHGRGGGQLPQSRCGRCLTCFEPDIEALPWAEQLRLDDGLYRRQIAYLLDPFALLSGEARPGRITRLRRGRRARRDRRAAAHREGRTAHELQRARCRSARMSPCPHDRIVRIYSTSGTTGTPSYIPLTAADLDNWVTELGAQLCGLGGQRRARRSSRPTMPGRSSPAPRSPPSTGCGLCHIPVGTGNTERLMAAIRLLKPTAAVMTPSYALHLAEWAARARFRPRTVKRGAAAGRGRAGRRRAGDAGAARGGMGRQGHRGDGHRRHRGVAVGRMRSADAACISAAAASSMPS